MPLNEEFQKVYPDLDAEEAIVGEDGPYPFCGGELTEVWFEADEEYSTCYYLEHPKLGTLVLKDFEAMCAFVDKTFGG